MQIANPSLGDLLKTPPTEPQAGAEQANLCLESRVSASRQTDYEGRVATAANWADWRGRHARYVKNEVRRRSPLSATFAVGEPSLRPGVETNQWLIRIERIDDLLTDYGVDTGRPLPAATLDAWIKSARGPNGAAPSPGPRTTNSLADLGRLTSGASATASPEVRALEDLTDFFNQQRADGRPSFVAFDAECPDIATRPDWAAWLSDHCGLAHLFAGAEVTLALFRYRVQEVLNGQPKPYQGATVFAVPTVLDHPFYNVFHPAPDAFDWGQAVGLAPQDDCGHLVAELVHARIEYQAQHWVRVGTLNRPTPTEAEIDALRDQHLACLRVRPGLAGYGKGC